MVAVVDIALRGIKEPGRLDVAFDHEEICTSLALPSTANQNLDILTVCDHNSRDTGHKQAISGQELGESLSGGHDLPGHDSERQELNKEESSAHVDVPGNNERDVRAKGNHIGSDVGAENANCPGECCEEDGKTSCGRIVTVLNSVEKIPRVPGQNQPRCLQISSEMTYQSCSPHLPLMAAVARIPKVAARVQESGLKI